MFKTIINLIAAAWMLTVGVCFTLMGAGLCLAGPLGATFGVVTIGVGLYMAWDAGCIAAGD